MVNEFPGPDDASSSSYRHHSFHLQPLFRKSVRTIAIFHDPIPPLSSIMLSKLRPDMFLLFRSHMLRYSSHPFSMRLKFIKDLYWLKNGIGSSYSIVTFSLLRPGSVVSYLVIRYLGRFRGEEEGRERRVIRSVNHAIISLSHYIMNGPLLKLNNVIYMKVESWTCLSPLRGV